MKQSFGCAISVRHSAKSALHLFIAQLEWAAQFERDDATETRLDKLKTRLGQVGEVGTETIALFADLLGLFAEGRYSALPPNPQRKRDMTLTALLGQLDALARQHPVLMVFEDAH